MQQVSKICDNADSGSKFHEPGRRNRSRAIFSSLGPGHAGTEIYWPGADQAELCGPAVGKSWLLSKFQLYQQ